MKACLPIFLMVTNYMNENAQHFFFFTLREATGCVGKLLLFSFLVPETLLKKTFSDDRCTRGCQST